MLVSACCRLVNRVRYIVIQDTSSIQLRLLNIYPAIQVLLDNPAAIRSQLLKNEYIGSTIELERKNLHMRATWTMSKILLDEKSPIVTLT